MHIAFFRGAALVCIGVAMLWNNPAFAVNGVVSTPNCNEAGFVNVLNTVDGSGGGTITFNCGNAPVTITFSLYKQIVGHDIIDGGGRITFDGNNASAFFQVFGSASLTLKNLTFTRGVFNASHALENFGQLTLDTVAMNNNVSTDSVIVNFGGLSIRSSTFTGNSASVGSSGAVVYNNSGTVQIGASTFSNNSVDGGNSGTGGAIANGSGDIHVFGSAFTGNSAFDGGAIFVASDTTASVAFSTFSNNSAGYGGAIETFGALEALSNSTFTGNQALSNEGGAVWIVGFPGASANIDRSQFTSNHAAGQGGAISCEGDALVATNSAFGNNHTDTNGGAIYGACTIDVNNATFNANSATIGGGAIYQTSSSATVDYVTIDSNTAPFGAGLYNNGSGSSSLTISRSIVSGNTTGNCDGVITSNGYNLSNDSGCGSAFTQTGDVINANLPLGTFANNGGPTLTQLPLSGNQAIDHIPSSSCGQHLDQRRATRPAGTGCDSGAVELNGIIDTIFSDDFNSY